MAQINIGTDFSKDPAGRYYTDGEGSGEEFREKYLLPKLRSLAPNETLEIILDDEVEGYGSSFLVEGFAGVVKFGYYPSDKLLSMIKLKYSEPDFSFYKEKIIQYIKEAQFNSKKYTPTKQNG